MNFPPMKIGENFQLREDIVNLFQAFGVRAPQMIAVDLKARCTTADRVRTRLIELCDKEGPDYLRGLFRKMLMMAEQGARERIRRSGPTANIAASRSRMRWVSIRAWCGPAT